MKVTDFSDMKELGASLLDNYRHFVTYALFDVAWAVELRSPMQCNLTGVKANLGQGTESALSILKLNRDTGCLLPA